MGYQPHCYVRINEDIISVPYEYLSHVTLIGQGVLSHGAEGCGTIAVSHRSSGHWDTSPHRYVRIYEDIISVLYEYLSHVTLIGQGVLSHGAEGCGT